MTAKSSHKGHREHKDGTPVAFNCGSFLSPSVLLVSSVVFSSLPKAA
jgi:hypothetical protein